jgi:hypothetical protein
MKKTTGLSTSCATALNKTSVERFYSLLEELIEEFNIEVRNMYNMDEKGVQLGIGAKVRHLILMGFKCCLSIFRLQLWLIDNRRIYTT